MNNNILKHTRELCGIYDLKPRKTLGQNFLVEKKVYEKIVTEAELSPKDRVLEVGPGLGFLTGRLRARAGKVVSVELDEKLAEVLETALLSQGVENARVLNSNILDWDFRGAGLPDFKEGYKIVANLPYNITSKFLRKFLSGQDKPELMVLLLQKEVAERIAARPPQMSLLAVSVQYYANPCLVEKVPASSFWPRPKVDSAIVKIKLKDKFPLSPEEEKKFFRLVKFGFSSRRKMLKNNLAAALRADPETLEKALVHLKFNPKIRAQDLSVPDWLKLFGSLGEYVV